MSQMPAPKTDFPLATASWDEAEYAAIQRVVDSGRFTMGPLVAEFERDLLIERTQAGLKRAKADGKVLGRPSLLSSDQHAEVCARRAMGASLAVLARELGVSRSAIHRAEKRRSP